MAHHKHRHYRDHGSPRKANHYDAKLHRERQEAKARRRAHAARLKVKRSGCYDPDVRQGAGAVLVAVGVLAMVAGIVMTAVDANDNDGKNKYPGLFAWVGPLLIAISVIVMFVGLVLSSQSVFRIFQKCANDPESFCRVHCPALSHLLKPDEAIAINESAIKALQSQPSRSVLKRQPPPTERTIQEEALDSDDVFQKSTSGDIGSEANPAVSVSTTSEVKYVHPGSRLGSRAVRFSESDLDGFRDTRAASVTSTSSKMSAVSLKNCKIHPKNGVWWTETQKNIPHGAPTSTNVPSTTDL